MEMQIQETRIPGANPPVPLRSSHWSTTDIITAASLARFGLSSEHVVSCDFDYHGDQNAAEG